MAQTSSDTNLDLKMQEEMRGNHEGNHSPSTASGEKSECHQKVDNHSPNEKFVRELRAELADSQFNLKRLNEDIATERTLMELDKIKFMKGYEQRISELKQKMENDNQDWIKRFDLQTQEYQEGLEKMRKEFSDQSQAEISEYRKTAHLKLEETITQNKEVIETLRTKIITIEKVHAEEKDHMVKEAEEKLGRELKAVHDNTNQLIENKQREFQLSKSLIERERKQEETKHQMTKKQFSGVKDNLYEQIYKLTTEKVDLEEQVKVLQFETTEKTRRINCLNESIRELEISHEQKIKKLIDTSKETLENIKNKSTGDFKQIYQAQVIYIDTITAQMATLQQKHQDIIQFQKSQFENLSKDFSQRPSKSQDIDIIKGLKEKLWKKEKDLELSQEETTWYKRELENRDEMYTKLFNGGNAYVPYETTRPRKQSENIKTMPISPVNNRKTTKSLGGRSLIGRKKLEELKLEKSEIEQPQVSTPNNYYLQVPKSYV